MNNRIYHIAFFTFILLSFFTRAQEFVEFQKEIKSDSIVVLQKTDSLSQKVNYASQHISTEGGSSYESLVLRLDTSTNDEITKLNQVLQSRFDSLKAKGRSSISLQQTLDSLSNNSALSKSKHQEFLSLDKKIKEHIKNKPLDRDTLAFIKNNVNEKVNDIRSVSTDLGIDPLGEDLKPHLNTSIPKTHSSRLPSEMNIATNISKETGGLNTELPTEKIPGKDIKILPGQLPEKAGDIKNKAGEVTEAVQQAGDLAENTSEYAKELKTIKEEGLSKSEKLPELAEQQASQLEEVKALQAQEAVSTKQLEEYKKLIEQYKDEKRIHEELKEKTKELATEKITANQGKVNDAMKKIGKYKRKFSEVHDMRNLPKHAPNPMKDKSWRERVVPGLTFQTFSSNATWLEFDPQVYYKLNGNLSAGIGGMYRFSMNPGKFTFDDFGSMSGAKIFAQYHIMKGFFVRGEGQYVRWKPWDLKLTDPTYIDHTYVAAAGIGKSYQIAKKLKGNIQTLYHFHWEGMDPYKPKVMIRMGFDFSLKKREEKHWEKKLKERKQELKK